MDAHTRTCALVFGYSVTFRFVPDPARPRLDIEWAPRKPRRADFRSDRAVRQLLAAYERARNDFTGDVAAIIRGRVAILDHDGKSLRATVVNQPARQ